MSYCNFSFLSNLFSFGSGTESPRNKSRPSTKQSPKLTDRVLSGLDCKTCSLFSSSSKIEKNKSKQL